MNRPTGDCGARLWVAPDCGHGEISQLSGDGAGARGVGRGDGDGCGAARQFDRPHKESLLDYIDREKIFILPNTAGCYSADEAVRTARLGREVGLSEWVKLEVIGDEQTLFPIPKNWCAPRRLW